MMIIWKSIAISSKIRHILLHWCYNRRILRSSFAILWQSKWPGCPGSMGCCQTSKDRYQPVPRWHGKVCSIKTFTSKLPQANKRQTQFSPLGVVWKLITAKTKQICCCDLAEQHHQLSRPILCDKLDKPISAAGWRSIWICGRQNYISSTIHKSLSLSATYSQSLSICQPGPTCTWACIQV